MNDATQNRRSGNDLRWRAEEFLLKSPSAIKKMPARDLRDLKDLVEELRIHQVELEMRQEELQRSLQKLGDVRDRYQDLYDFAPVGYFALSSKGSILEANLTASTLLGISRSDLVGKPLSHFIAEEDQDIFYLHLNELLGKDEKRSCELRFKKKEGNELPVLWSAEVIDLDGEDCLLSTVMDISALKRAEKERLEKLFE